MKSWSRFSPVVAALVALGAVVWSGCGSGDERYSCDATGCYSCDGYGCRDVPAPTPVSCSGDQSGQDEYEVTPLRSLPRAIPAGFGGSV